jgi:hypothetical protein
MLLQWNSSTRVPSNLGGVHRGHTMPSAVRALEAQGIGSLPWIIFAEFMLFELLPSRLRRWRLLAPQISRYERIVFVW